MEACVSITMKIRSAVREDLPFLVGTAHRLAAFGPPAWRTADEVVGGEVRTLKGFFDARPNETALLIVESERVTESGMSIWNGFRTTLPSSITVTLASWSWLRSQRVRVLEDLSFGRRKPGRASWGIPDSRRLCLRLTAGHEPYSSI